jgi:hypothetical protein
LAGTTEIAGSLAVIRTIVRAGRLPFTQVSKPGNKGWTNFPAHRLFFKRPEQ